MEATDKGRSEIVFDLHSNEKVKNAKDGDKGRSEIVFDLYLSEIQVICQSRIEAN
jgi:hypothetical protein